MRISQAFLPLAAALLIAGCGNRSTAENVVGQAEAAVNAQRDAATTYAPEELKAAEGTLAQMKQNLDGHKYKEVVDAVPQFNTQVKTLQDAVVAKQQENTAATDEWTTINAEVPKSVQAIQAQVDKLNGGKLPKDVTKEQFETAKTDFETLKTTWAEATAAANAGKTVEATEKGRIVQAKANDLKAQLKVTESASLASSAPAPAAG